MIIYHQNWQKNWIKNIVTNVKRKKRKIKTSDTKNKQEEIEAIAGSLKQEYLVSHKKHLTIKEKISAAILSSLPLTMGLVGIVSSTIAALPDIVIPHLVPSKKEQ